MAACFAAGTTDTFAAAFSLTLLGMGGAFLASGSVGLYVARIYRVISQNGPGYVVRKSPRTRTDAAESGAETKRMRD